MNPVTFAHRRAGGADAAGGNTNCSTPKPHADISGNGLVWTENFTFITNKFLGKSEPNCCPMALGTVAGDDYGPVTRISVKELRRLDLYDMIAADLNGDGRVDEEDIEAFMDGARPAPEGTKGRSRTGSGIR